MGTEVVRNAATAVTPFPLQVTQGITQHKADATAGEEDGAVGTPVPHGGPVPIVLLCLHIYILFFGTSTPDQGHQGAPSANEEQRKHKQAPQTEKQGRIIQHVAQDSCDAHRDFAPLLCCKAKEMQVQGQAPSHPFIAPIAGFTGTHVT